MDRPARLEAETDLAQSFGPHIGGYSGEWASFGALIRSDPLAAWSRLLSIVAITDQDGLFWVADILEDLVQIDHRTFVPLIAAELATNRQFGDAFLYLVPTAPEEDVDAYLLELREGVEHSRIAEVDGDG